MDIEQLDAIMAIVPPDEPADPEEQVLIDIKEAIELFATTKVLLDFLANPMLCKTVTKRERLTLDRVSEQIRRFLAEVVPTYEE